ncbi:signal transduction histidine kinase [Catenuloplanes nepalensis]|uniref:histidine kinase n=1 Tax=Catenuloplanes nepalensis TaxID=587533 RepID=A0ABT9MPG3_9ACTN|nr:sensor histidine kinase [Catenuloplanes nepalensis]MDP9793288.1 signal transduction histidine kinase [Catenuloplanes nepalensis]
MRAMASGLYLVVLAAGLGYPAPAASPARLVVFAVAIAALLLIEWIPEGPPIPLLAARLALYAAVAVADPGGFGRALFILAPFFAYVTLGRRAAITIAAACMLVASVQAARAPAWHTDQEAVSDLLMFGIGLVLTLVTAEVADGQRRSRERAERLVGELRTAQRQVAQLSAAAERHRLARDIHDSVGHHLTAVSVQLAKAEAFRSRDPAVADRAVLDARAAATRALQEVRTSVSALRTASFSLADAVEELAGGLDDAGFEVTVTRTGGESGHARHGLEALYRVTQEALTNAHRHAGADRVTVALCFDDAATVEITDNGRGFTVDDADGGGLRGMRERLAALGGTLHIDSGPGRGTRITARVGGAPASAPGREDSNPAPGRGVRVLARMGGAGAAGQTGSAGAAGPTGGAGRGGGVA